MCIRDRFIVVDGEEKTTNFFTEEQWVISLNNFNSMNHAGNNLQCVEDTTVSVGNEEQAQKPVSYTHLTLPTSDLV